MSKRLTPIMIMPKKTSSSVVQISLSLFNKLQIKESEKLNITIGRTTKSIQIQTIKVSADKILIPEHILNIFFLPQQIHKFYARYQADIHTLKLGPVIGLLTESPVIEKAGPHFRSVHSFCEELQQGISENGGFFYIFSYDQFPGGGYLLQNGKWSPSTVPLPDVVYNRIHSRAVEYKITFKDFRQRLDQLSIPFFNDRFFSKWEVYEWINEDRHLSPYIPETKIFSKENLLDLAQKYETIFIKPIHGSQGRNIIKLTIENSNLFSLQSSFTGGAQAIEKNNSLTDIYQQIKSLLPNRMAIIQQGISFIPYEACPTDFRVLCHKSDEHRWEVTSVVARVGAKEEFVSNLARGGTMMRPLKVLCSCMNQKRALEVLELAKELSLETAALISRYGSGITGELGIDIGVDLNGKPWLIEVNAKPSKIFEGGSGKIRPSASAIIQFCTMLAFDSITEKEVG